MEANKGTRRRRRNRPRQRVTQNQNHPQQSSPNKRRNFSRPNLHSVQNIINLYRKTPSEIILELFNPRFDLEKLLEMDEIDDDLAIKLIFLFEKAFECNSMSTKLDALMKLICPCKFFQEHIFNILSPSRDTFVESVLNLCSIFVYLDSFNTTTLEALKSKLEYVIIYLPKFSQQLNDLEKFFEESENLNKRKRGKTFSNLDQNGEQDDFTKMNIVPKLEDILNDQTNFLRKNLTNGSYQSVHHYLDTQYRLLREDFMRPLRDGVCSFRDIVKSYKIRNRKKDELSKEIMKQLRQIDNLNVYFNVFMESCIAIPQGIVYSLKLDLNGMKILDPRRLIFGSLICLSSDYFQSECLIGTISEKDKDFLKTGIIYVKFSHSYLDINERKNIPIANVRYVMLESTVYFEAYKHVLKALCSFHRDGEYKFPFREHLIYSEHSMVEPPDYLINSGIDFRPLVVKKNTYYHSSLFGNVSFRDQNNWPSADDMKLSPAQYDAVKLALNNKLTLIQGPPGTGKTFVGVKIVKLLLHNKNLWWNLEDDRCRPILMVCYTNHALDQFLEYCIDECDLTEGVVRVGGRSRSERLAPFLLSNIKQKLRNENKINRSIKISIGIELKKLEGLRNRLNYLNEPINTILNYNAILRINILKDYMNEKHHDQMIMYSDSLFDKNDLDNDFCLLEWLGFFQDSQYSLKQEEPSTSQINSITEEDQYDSDNEDLINQRVLESDIRFKNIKKNLKNKNKYLLYENDISKMIDAFQILKNDQVKPEKFNIVNYLRTKTNESLKFSEEDFSLLENVINIWKLDYDQRFFLYLNWLRKFLSQQEELIENVTLEYNKSASIVEELRLQEDKNVMEQALIVAMTTTGSTRYHNILKDIGPRIVIVEEAAEVFEAHIVGSLSKHCEHLILIGDHVQLRPNPAVYSLAREYKLDVSLFERLVNNDFKRVMLNKQHRMRPEISVLMKYFYDKPIENNESVYRFPSITGVTKSVFFINHKNMEKSNSGAKASKLNPFEKNYLVKLAVYLTNCKYAQEDITILSMYLGQTMDIKKQLKVAKLDRIKVSTVDNYQGEENKIILLSLVRSNTEKKIGFLNISNRVCVALSRAKHGFYTIGNFDFICSYESNNKWKQIVNEMKLNDNFGDLTLTCVLHKENDIKILNLTDFDQRKNCCCNSKCDILLNCGHKCPQKCHVLNDLEHLKYKCKQVCKKSLMCGHLCSQICCEHKNCNKCGVLVNKIIIECGHILLNIRCDLLPTRSMCNTICNKKLSCGHLCSQICNKHDKCAVCPVIVDKNIQQCGHIIKGIRCDFIPMRKDCNEICNKKLSCGHLCSQICNKHDKCAVCPVIVDKNIQQCGHIIKGIRCDFIPMRKDCNEICNKKLSCGHLCSQICNKHLNCFKCEIKVDKIIKECGHEIKSFRCDSEPIRKNCVQKCNKKMYCGHNCEEKCSDHIQCTKCSVKVFKKIKDCGHMVEVRCDYVPTRLDCKELCVKTLKCGHLCTKKCSILDCGKCENLIDVNSTCKHPSLIQSKCSNKIWHYQQECKRPCYEVLKCGHVCESSCSDCFGGYVHTRCKKQVEVKFRCGHITTTNCFSQQNLICQSVCSNFCPHGTCSKPCGQPCTPCDRPCEYKCEHFSCSKKCHEFCDRPVCNEPCKNKLKCGHNCIGICGEPCPKICRVCNRDTNELFANTEAKFVLLVQCGHIFESSYLDSYMRKQSLELINQFPQCPWCKTPIRFNYRYSKLIKAQLIEFERAKTTKIGNERQNELFKSNLLDQIKNFNQSNDEFDNKLKNLISSDLEKLNFLSQNNLKLYDTTWNLFINLKIFKNGIKIKCFERQEHLEHLIFEVEKLQDLFIFEQGELNLFQSEQMLNDFMCELSRLNYLVSLFNLEIKFEKNFKNSKDPMKVSSLLARLGELLYNKVNKFESDLQFKADEYFKKIEKQVPIDEKKNGCVIS
ncbi:unnamed protein product [Brachionus calyciflorus]|uniref:NF-X1-type domain-containing protein n=1 Tax=Brachionus calyciflorus TaxID=104777 RepID=A0A813NS39_9BILA|nr:unnamed protein product [Brachionus calyciflorus]